MGKQKISRYTLHLLVSIIMIVFQNDVHAGDKALDWENPEMIGINKEPAHCTYIPYSTVDLALTDTQEVSPFFKSLNGQWKFNWVEKPADRPVDFYKEDYDVSEWKDIPVPGTGRDMDMEFPFM